MCGPVEKTRDIRSRETSKMGLLAVTCFQAILPGGVFAQRSDLGDAMATGTILTVEGLETLANIFRKAGVNQFGAQPVGIEPGVADIAFGLFAEYLFYG